MKRRSNRRRRRMKLRLRRRKARLQLHLERLTKIGLSGGTRQHSYIKEAHQREDALIQCRVRQSDGVSGILNQSIAVDEDVEAGYSGSGMQEGRLSSHEVSNEQESSQLSAAN